uniref:Uncharacterized protein n=1 Tax=Moniliophthora roreri TaxID=221103 RepID=A0A0W0G4E8_MONRR
MADSVALLFATNLTTIGGHTRRRRRSPSVDFNITEGPPRSMSLGTTNSIDALAKCIANLVSVVQALESLTADEALPEISKGRERFEELMQEHREYTALSYPASIFLTNSYWFTTTGRINVDEEALGQGHKDLTMS